jgi:hypothetical protein
MRAAVDWDDKRLGRHLKLRDLNVLLTVVRCGSMGKAAAELALSQPAVSKAIAEMEFHARRLSPRPQPARLTFADDSPAFKPGDGPFMPNSMACQTKLC